MIILSSKQALLNGLHLKGGYAMKAQTRRAENGKYSNFETKSGVCPYMRVSTVTNAHQTLLLDDRHDFHMDVGKSMRSYICES